jgi:hypothetical protein
MLCEAARSLSAALEGRASVGLRATRKELGRRCALAIAFSGIGCKQSHPLQARKLTTDPRKSRVAHSPAIGMIGGFRSNLHSDGATWHRRLPCAGADGRQQGDATGDRFAGTRAGRGRRANYSKLIAPNTFLRCRPLVRLTISTNPIRPSRCARKSGRCWPFRVPVAVPFRTHRAAAALYGRVEARLRCRWELRWPMEANWPA